MDEREMVNALRKAGYSVAEPQPKPKPDQCSICGVYDGQQIHQPRYYNLEGIDTESDDLEISDWITKIRVEIGDSGEEGWDFKVLKFCDQHDTEMIDKLIELGFKTHHHGSTHPLEDPDCDYGCDQQGSPYDEDENNA